MFLGSAPSRSSVREDLDVSMVLGMEETPGTMWTSCRRDRAGADRATRRLHIHNAAGCFVAAHVSGKRREGPIMSAQHYKRDCEIK